MLKVYWYCGLVVPRPRMFVGAIGLKTESKSKEGAVDSESSQSIPESISAMAVSG